MSGKALCRCGRLSASRFEPFRRGSACLQTRTDLGVLQLIYHAREDVDALGDGVLVDGRVAEDEAAGGRGG